MSFLQTTLLFLLSVTLACGCGNGGDGDGGQQKQCVSGGGTGFTLLYNTCVTRAQRYKRPLLTTVGEILAVLGVHHQGVVVTLDNGQRWLVHKGNEYGTPSETVVADASIMSSDWFPSGFSKTIQYSNVGDYVDAGGSVYHLRKDNCIHAANRMMALN